MKKIAFVMMAVMLAGATASIAAETATYDEMKAIKARQRQEREAKKSAIQSGTYQETKMQKFWKNEGERSGLGSSKERVGTFFSRLNPAPFFARQREQYEARKAGGVK
jgi:hypothetical protein